MAKRRRKGCGCVFLQGGTWYARWTDLDGRRATKSTGIREGDRDADGRTAREMAEDWLEDRTAPLRMRYRADALALVAAQLQTVEERIAADVARARRRTALSDLERMFRSSPRRRDCSADMLDFYCRCLRRFVDFAGPSTPVDEAGGETADAYARNLAQGARSASSYNKHLNALTLVWRVCGRDAGLAQGENPWADMARRRSDAHVRRPFTRDEAARIMAAAQGETRTLVAVLLWTGLRLGDAATLRWEDVRGDAIHVVTAKRDRKVAIPVHPALAEALGRRRASGWVMPSTARAYRGPHGDSAVSRRVSRLIAGVGIATSVGGGKGRRARPDATAHSFRHTFVTNAIEAGVPPHVVQQIVGHASGTMTERYTHLSDEAVLAAFAAMGADETKKRK